MPEHAFLPVLAQRCKHHRLELLLADLRWRVETVEERDSLKFQYPFVDEDKFLREVVVGILD